MVSWCVEVKPGQPYVHEPGLGLLRITQAILGSYYDTDWTTLQCSIGDRSPVSLCALNSVATMRQVDLQYNENKNVVFSVDGNCSVHLSGYYIHHHNADDGSFSKKPSEKVRGHPMNDGSSQKNPIVCDDEDDNGNHGIITNTLPNRRTLDKRKRNTPSSVDEAPNYPNNGMDRENKQRDSEIMDSRTVDISPGQSHDIKHEGNAIHSSAQENKTPGDEVQLQSADLFLRDFSTVDISPGQSHNIEHKDNAIDSSTQEKNNNRGDEVQHQSADPLLRIPDDGEMSIEDLESGDANYGVASEGKMIRVKYVGKLVDGKAFDPPNGKDNTHEFMLGAREIIRGWNFGIEGMCVGGRRRLSIPPALGYADFKDEPLANSWLFYDVKLLAVWPRKKKHQTSMDSN